MSGFNLPPGVNESMIPGNRPEDEAWEKFMDWAFDELADSGLCVSEAKRAILIGVAGVKAEREEVKDLNVPFAG